MVYLLACVLCSLGWTVSYRLSLQRGCEPVGTITGIGTSSFLVALIIYFAERGVGFNSVAALLGTCGGFADGLKAGDLFAADEAYCGEGASQYYGAKGKRVRATVVLSDVPEDDRQGIFIARGAIYTTSALFAEGREDIEKWAEQGFSAVDMETAASFAVAEHFGMDRGSILTVFDNPLGQDHILSEDSEKDERRQNAQRAMVEIALDAIARRVDDDS